MGSPFRSEVVDDHANRTAVPDALIINICCPTDS
jgi:hypothetical protein